MATYILELLYAPLSPQKALDKLSRLGSPSPSRNHTRSPAPSVASASSSRLSHPPRQTRASTENLSPALHELGRSGSETERESTTQYTSTHSHSSHSSSSHSRTYSLASPRKQAVSISSSIRSSTPPPADSSHHSPYSRYRHLSAPGSPNKARLAASSAASSVSNSNSNSNSSSSPSNRRRNRTSMASVSQLQLTDFEEEEDDEEDNLKTATGMRTRSRQKTLSERDLITQSALVAVASSRSPVGARRRSALPMEFRSDLIEQSPSPRPGSAGRKVSAYIHLYLSGPYVLISVSVLPERGANNTIPAHAE